MIFRLFFLAVFIPIFSGTVGPAVPPAARSASQSASHGKIDGNALAKEVIQNELRSEGQDRSQWKFREVRQQGGKTELYEVVQTKFGEIKRLLSVNGQPLSGEARRNEERRIRKLIANDEEFQKKQKEKKDDGDQSRKMLAMLPQAFNFHYDGIQSGLIRLVFTPNLNFHPTDREAEVFHHMEGVLFVTPEQKRLAGIDGLLTTPVKFAGGLLGHLDKGGTFSVRQKDMGSGHWEITLLDVHMKRQGAIL